MLIRTEPRHPGIRLLGAIYGAIVLGFLAGAWVLDVVRLPLPECHFRRFTGLPCVSCGSTRCYVAAAHGHLLTAFLYNPLIFVVSVSLLVWGAWSIIATVRRLPGWRVELTRGERRAFAMAVVFTVLANWIYLILTLPE